MPYQPGAVVHGVTHIADVYKSGNVYANNVKVALWLPPGVSEAFAFDPVVAPANSYEVSTEAVAEATALAASPPSVPATSVAQGAVESGYQGTPKIEVTTSTGIITNAVSTDLVAWMTARIDEGKKGMWTRVSKPAPAPPASKAESNPNLMGIWTSIGLSYYANHDQTAWCMGFVNFALKQNGYVWCKEASSWAIRDRPQKWNATRIDLDKGQPGDIALWNYGHVNFVYTANNGKYTFCGGNQGGKTVTNNPQNSCVSQSWPSGYKAPGDGTLIGLWRPSKVAPT
jgi:CHAP domain